MKTIITKPIAKPKSLEILMYVSGVALLFASSQIYIPLDPVPITMQSVGIMLIALLYDTKRGLITYGFYMALGAMGVPMFASLSAGINTIFGSCLGYFIGFGVAIYTMNLIKEKIGTHSFIKIALNCFIGTIIIFIFGIFWLSLSLGFKEAIMVGLVPFIFPGMVKTVVLSVVLRTLKTIK